MIKSIEAAQVALASQRRANEVGRRMEDFLAAASQRSASTASRFGGRAGAPTPTPAPESGQTDLRGETLYRQGAVARGDHDDSREANRAGAAAGDSEALELRGARTQRLDAILKLEVQRARSSPDVADDQQGQTSWYYQPTRGGEAGTGFARSREPARFAHARAMNPERVTVQNRHSVKEYFIKLHEGDMQ